MGLFDFLRPANTPDRFARLVIAHLRKLAPDRPVRYDAEHFQLTDAGGARINLHNFFTEYQRMPRAVRKRLLDSLAQTLLFTSDAPVDLATASAGLLPRVRERAYRESVRLQCANATEAEADELMVCRPLNDHLTLELVIDGEHTIQSVGTKTLREWGRSIDDLLPQAVDQLWKRSNQNFVELAPGLWKSPWEDSHDVSRLYLPDLIWQLPVKGRHVAFVPHRDLLLVTGSDDAPALAAALNIVEEVASTQPRFMTGRPFILDGRDWLPWEPDGNREIDSDLRAAILISDARLRNDQSATLDQRHQSRNIDLPSSQVQVLSVEGSLVSYTTWADVPSLICDADLIAIAAPAGARDDELPLYLWSDVRARLGNLMKPTNDWPTRYRVERVPSQSERAGLRAFTPETLAQVLGALPRRVMSVAQTK